MEENETDLMQAANIIKIEGKLDKKANDFEKIMLIYKSAIQAQKQERKKDSARARKQINTAARKYRAAQIIFIRNLSLLYLK